MQPPPGGPPAAGQSPLLRIRAGIEAGSVAEVQAGVRDADDQGVQLAQNVRDMIKQWLAVNNPSGANLLPPAVHAAPQAQAAAPAKEPSKGNDEGVTRGEGTSKWSSTRHVDAEGTAGLPGAMRARNPKVTNGILRSALLKFFEGAPKGSDAALGLGIMECEDGERFLPLPLLGKAVGLTGQDFEIAQAVWHEVNDAPKGTFCLSEDARGVGLVEWAGWEAFASAMAIIVDGTRDPAFEPRSIQGAIARAARGAVKAVSTRKDDLLRMLKEHLSPQDLPDDAAPALRSAISRRTRLALVCLVDAIAKYGLGADAGPESMGLVGQLPRTVFGAIFDRIDDRDRGACAFLGEIIDSWDRRRCFSKKWLQDAKAKFSIPRGANPERDEGRGWYALTADNLHKVPKEDLSGSKEAPPPLTLAPETKAPRDKDRDRGRERDRVVEDVEAKAEAPKLSADEQLAALVKGKRAATTTVGGGEEGGEDGKQGKKRRLQHDDEDDDTVAKTLEASRKRRAELLQKYKG